MKRHTVAYTTTGMMAGMKYITRRKCRAGSAVLKTRASPSERNQSGMQVPNT